MTSVTRRFSTNVVLTLGTRLVMLASGIGASIVIARSLGARGVGIVAVLNVIVAVAVQIGSAGLPSANTYFVGREPQLLGRISANSLMFAFISGTVLAVATCALALFRPTLFGAVPFPLIGVAAVSIPFVILLSIGSNLLLATGNVDGMNIIDALSQLLLFVTAVLVLLVIRGGLLPLVSGNLAVAILTSAILAGMTANLIRKHGGKGLRVDGSLFRRILPYGIKFYVSLLAGVIILRADLLLVNHFRGAAEAGPYAIAAQIGNLMLLLPAIIGALLFPRVVAEADTRANFTMRATRHTAFLMAIVCLAAVPLSYALPVIYGAAFRETTPLLLILLPGLYLYGIEAVMVQHFTGTGLPNAIPLFWVAALLFNIVLNLVFIPAYGARAAAVTSTLTYAAIFCLVAFYFRRKTGNRLSRTLLLERGEFNDLPALVRLGLFSR